MYSILIIDDEPYAVEALKRTINWNELNIDKVFCTCYTDEAIEILMNESIDICLSDIVMPGKTGFDIMEFIKDNKLDTKVIMTTAHENFWYIKKALALGAVEYLLKPIQFDALKKAVAAAAEFIESERQKQDYMEKYRESCDLWNSNIPYVVERFWRDALSGRFCLNKNKLTQFFRNVGKPLEEEIRFIVILISLDEWDDGLFDEDMLNYGIRNMAQETITDIFGGEMLEDDNGNNIGIVYCKGEASEAEAEKACEKLVNYCDELLHVKISCYLGAVTEIESVIDEYRYIQQKYWSNFRHKGSIIRKDEDIEAKEEIVQLPFFMNTDNALEYTRKEQLIKEINTFFENNTHMAQETNELIYHGMMFYIYDFCNKRGMNISELSDMPPEKGTEYSSKKLGKWCTDVIEELMEKCESDTHDGKIAMVKHYIEENYMNPISRDTISNELFFNASYLSRLFKKSIGLSIFEYLAQVRVEAAKKMLVGTDKKISDIAMEVGYNHFSHFANVFKNITGLTPKDYRELNKR